MGKQAPGKADKTVQGNILIVDDEADMMYTCSRILEDLPVTISKASSGKEALGYLAHEQFDLALLDIIMPKMNGLDLLREIKKSAPETEVIMLTGFPTVESAVDAVKEGALDYLTKPFSPEQLKISVEKALAVRELKRENLRLKAYARKCAGSAKIIGTSPALQASFELINRAAGDQCNVLIIGETGTGKELCARAIHAQSERRDMPFVPIDCGALSEELLGSELFGHEKGAFTGANDRRIGILEYANGGVVFLDEIGEMSRKLQVALLRFIEERQFRRIGSNKYVHTDIRVVAAANTDLDSLVQEGRFRQDLYFRLNVLTIELPPLRERKEDIPLLAKAFVSEMSSLRQKPVPTIAPDTMAVLTAYGWPGNVRDLHNVMERAVLLCDSGEITLDLLPDHFRNKRAIPAEDLSEFRRAKADAIESFERIYLSDLLRKTEGNIRQAARIAGMPRSSMQRLLKKYKEGG